MDHETRLQSNLARAWIALVLLGLGVMFVIPMLNLKAPRAEATIAINQLQILFRACRAYAADHEGNFPPTLGALYPEYVPNLDLFFSKEQGNRKRIVIYYPGLTEISPGGLPLLEYPVGYRGKRVIAHCGGHVKLVAEENLFTPKR